MNMKDENILLKKTGTLWR